MNYMVYKLMWILPYILWKAYENPNESYIDWWQIIFPLLTSCPSAAQAFDFLLGTMIEDVVLHWNVVGTKCKAIGEI